MELIHAGFFVGKQGCLSETGVLSGGRVCKLKSQASSLKCHLGKSKNNTSLNLHKKEDFRNSTSHSHSFNSKAFFWALQATLVSSKCRHLEFKMCPNVWNGLSNERAVLQRAARHACIMHCHIMATACNWCFGCNTERQSRGKPGGASLSWIPGVLGCFLQWAPVGYNAEPPSTTSEHGSSCWYQANQVITCPALPVAVPLCSSLQMYVF